MHDVAKYQEKISRIQLDGSDDCSGHHWNSCGTCLSDPGKYLKIACQTEAKTNLSAIYTAQKIYFTLNQSYADDINKLDLSLVQGDPYTFTMEASTSTFKVQAEGNIDDYDALDIWTIDQNKILFNDNDNVTAE